MTQLLGQQNPQLLPETWKLNEGIFFELVLNDLDEKITSAGYERHAKGNRENKLILLPLIVAFHTQTKLQLTSG